MCVGVVDPPATCSSPPFNIPAAEVSISPHKEERDVSGGGADCEEVKQETCSDEGASSTSPPSRTELRFLPDAALAPATSLPGSPVGKLLPCMSESALSLAADASRQESPGDGVSSPISVLCVDDNSTNMRILTRILLRLSGKPELQFHRLEITTAVNGKFRDLCFSFSS